MTMSCASSFPLGGRHGGSAWGSPKQVRELWGFRASPPPYGNQISFCADLYKRAIADRPYKVTSVFPACSLNVNSNQFSLNTEC